MKTGILHFDELPDHLKILGLPNDIPICEGQHTLEIDVDEGRLEQETVARMRGYAKENALAKGNLDPKAYSRPVGFKVSAAEKAGGKIIWDDEAEV